MDTAIDPIKALIETTGLSCDDLLQKLLEYKNQQTKNADHTGKTASSDKCTENGIEKHVESNPVICEKSCSPSCSDNPETISDADKSREEQKNPINGCNEDLGSNKSHHHPVQQDLEESNTLSRPEDTTTGNVSSVDEYEKKISNIDLKNTSNGMQGNLKTALSNSIDIPEVIKECQKKIETNNPETTSDVDNSSDKRENIINGSNEDVGTNKIHHNPVQQDLEESNTLSRHDDTITESAFSVDEHEKEIPRFVVKNTLHEMPANLKKPSTKTVAISENIKECQKIAETNNPETTSDVNNDSDERENIINRCSEDLTTNGSHNSHIQQVLEEPNTLSRPDGIETERVSIADKHKKELLSIDLKNTSNEIPENLKKPLTKPIDISEDLKESQKIIQNIGDIDLEHQAEATNGPNLENSHLFLVKNNSLLKSEECFLSESKEENGNESDKNVLICPNDPQIEKKMSPLLDCERNLEMSHTNSDTKNTILKDNAINYSSRQKSISDQLVQKFSGILKQHDQIASPNKEPIGNEIEVCQIEEIEVKPLLKLRSDLFATNSKGNFTVSDNEDENEDDTPELKEFLKNIEEVTGEVENQSSSKCPPAETCEEVVKVSPPRVRKVKLGFLKKRILHNAIKCMNGADKKSKHIMRNKRSFEPEKSNCDTEITNGNHVSEEEIRENLKIQLSSLRNRKKGTLIENKCNIDNLIINYDKHTFDKKKAPNSITTTDLVENSTTVDKPQHPLANITDNSSIKDIDTEVTEMKESLFSLSNDTDFMIVDVQGGVEFLDINESMKKTQNPPADLIKLTKTNDVTKIKGWQNKKFQLSPEETPKEIREETNLSSQKDCKSDASMPSCSKPHFIEEIEKSSKEELSPFVSNSLEEFLTENSTLNISYNIPKLGAVQGINNQRYNTVIIPHTFESTGSESEKKEEFEKPKSIKPKTLAEKRRMLGNTQSKVVINEENIFNKKSYVLYNGHKLYVPTTNSEDCLINIKFAPKSRIQRERSRPMNKINKNKRLSLLDMYHQASNCVSYKPGPLREKSRLQNKESILQWDTEIRRLPPIKLNIVSEVGKPIPPQLIHHFNFGPKIKEDRLELALSALLIKPGEKVKQGFRLTVPYVNNQKYVLVRKRKEISCDGLYDITPEKNTIGSVLDDIISYVENKENENLIIKDAEMYEDDEKHLSERDEARVSTDVNCIKKAKRRKLDSELLRLSCKVLSVSVDETEEDNQMCCKSFCKLGCVCKSLACNPPLPMHCSKVQCMFECKCSVSEKISLSVETGALTHDTVTRLEDQAKKNLARVEKEFTQTIIHANDKTILIPSSDRSKTKRVKRMPKRYSDFLEDFDDELKVNSSNDNQDNHSKDNFNCCIELQKLDIKGIIPLCIYHDIYNCACIHKPDEKICSENESNEMAQSRIEKSKKCSDVEKKKTVSKELKSMSGEGNSENITSHSDHMEEIKVVFDGRKVQEKMTCARILGVHPEIIARNEIPYYKKKIKSKVIQAVNSTFIDTTNLENISYSELCTESIDITTPLNILASDRLKLFIMKNHKHKRKQTFDNLDPIHKSKKLKRQEAPRHVLHRADEPRHATATSQPIVAQEPLNEPANKALDDVKKAENLPCTPVFNGEIIVPTNENRDFVKKLGVKSAAPYMRLLPWNDLLNNYYTGKINIWCPNDNYNKLLINVRDIGPPRGYIDITKSKRKNGIMNWILTKELPKQTPSELVHLILSPKEDYFEISGICLKNITEEEKAKKIIEMKKNEKTVSQCSMVVDQTNDSNDSKFYEHKNHNNETRLLIMTEKEYNEQFLYMHASPEQMDKEQFSPLRVGLPTFESLRWRMLFLNSNFTFLSFMKSDYSIKYTDLMNVLKKAQLCKKTICLQSKYLSKGYSQWNYGIYAVPKFIDTLFIGPYELNEEHGLQTLRYLRQELVSTKYFEMVQGGVIPNKKKDMWLISKDFHKRLYTPPKIKKKSPCSMSTSSVRKSKHSEYAVLTPLPNSSTNSSQENNTSDLECKIDAAEELHNFHSHLFDASGNFATSVDLDDKTFIKFPQFIILNGKTLRSQDYNRYLTSNIPDFGYLGAIKNEETKEIDVNWPFGNKVLRFANIPYAKQFIKRRFSNLLLPVPVTFNLQIFVKSDIENLKNMSPINPKGLNGTHICGTFGILDSRNLTPCLAQTLGTTQEDVLQRLAKRAQFLGGLEIEKLKAQEKVLISSKKELIMKKQRLLKKYMDLLLTLPEEQRLEVYTKFRQEFDGTASNDTDIDISSESPKKSEEVVECIDIEDSGSEEASSLEMEETTNLIENTAQKEMVMQTIPKPNILPQSSPSTCVEIESSRPVENFKLVKSSTGKLVLMKDNSGASLLRTLSGMKMRIKNNRVQHDTI